MKMRQCSQYLKKGLAKPNSSLWWLAADRLINRQDTVNRIHLCLNHGAASCLGSTTPELSTVAMAGVEELQCAET